MINWTAILNNKEVFVGKDMSSWRELKKKCDEENLSIVALLRDGKEIDPHPKAKSYFIMYDTMTTLTNSLQRTRICYGSFRENGKARLDWKVVQSNFDNSFGEHVEIVVPENAQSWQELCIPIDRGNNYDNIIKSHSS